METKLTNRGSDGRGNLQPKRQVKELCLFDKSVVATIASGYDKGYVEAVGTENIWL